MLNQRESSTEIVRVECRLFEARNEREPILYANPLRAWLGEAGTERRYDFPEWLVVEVELASGGIGIGNAGLAPRLAAAIVERHLAPLVIGRSAAELESLWQLMHRSTVPFASRGAGMVAISAVDIALWDARARSLGVPVHDLLGGRVKETIPVYASRLYGGDDLDALAAEATAYKRAGFTAVKQRFVWGPAEGRAGMLRNAELVRTVREAVGDDVDLMADAYMGWDLDYARRMLPLLEPYGLRWLEEPLLPDDLAGYRELRRRSPFPIAAGEHAYTLRGFAELVDRQAVDVLQFDTNRVGGISQARKICALAEAAGLPVVPHGGQQHNYHLVISQTACPMAEYFPGEDAIAVGNELPHWLFDGEPTPVAGHVRLAPLPGLGLAVAPRDPVAEIVPVPATLEVAADG